MSCDHFSPAIGVFDSGIGGLSVLRSLRQTMPHQSFIYVADSAHAPYGERSADFIIERSRRIAEHLIEQRRVCALVVACNTATAAAAAVLRQTWPAVPIVGVEPAIKPAASATRTGTVAVMATRGTVQSARFAQLIHSFGGHLRWRVRACDGLAAAIEAHDESRIATLVAEHVAALAPFANHTHDVQTTSEAADTLVLGCTHYVFALEALRHCVGSHVHIIDTASAVARQTQRVLALHNPPSAQPSPKPTNDPSGVYATVDLCTTGDVAALAAAAARWLDIGPQYVHHVHLP